MVRPNIYKYYMLSKISLIPSSERFLEKILRRATKIQIILKNMSLEGLLKALRLSTLEEQKKNETI